MRIGTNHHSSREGIIFKYHLMNDAGSRFPKTNTILVRHIPQEFKHFTVGYFGRLQVAFGIFICLDQVIAMHGGRHRHAGPSGVH